jgi:hypothetical protein
MDACSLRTSWKGFELFGNQSWSKAARSIDQFAQTRFPVEPIDAGISHCARDEDIELVYACNRTALPLE